MKTADITKILDAITDKVLAHGPTRTNVDKRSKPLAKKNIARKERKTKN